MSGVTSLGYLGLGVKNLDAWEKFAAARAQCFLIRQFVRG
jgi:hypothetical protein